MKKLLVLVFILLAKFSIGQDVKSITSDSLEFIVSDSDEGCFYKVGEKVPFTGIVEDFNSNGIAISYIEYIDGREQGIVKLFYDNGQIKNQVTINENGLEEGNFFEWYPNGAIKASGFFKNGQFDGIWYYYSDDRDDFKIIDTIKYIGGVEVD